MSPDASARPVEGDVPFDLIDLSVFAHSLAMIAEEMGSVLERGALSPNIRERRDASSAIFNHAGDMVAQAAHIPVHLGAMPESVRAVMARQPRPGDLFLLNDPFHGGSHLPDLTMVRPIDNASGIIGYAAVRAHHADVGGMSPGSMPQGATEIFQEGLIVPPVRLAREGVLDEEILALVLANVRTPHERRGDLAAQRAACEAGAAGWLALIAREGWMRVKSGCLSLLDYTERRTHRCLGQYEGATGVGEDALEGDGVTTDPVPVRVRATVRRSFLELDFTGTSPAVAGNVNCPAAVARAAAVFVVRTLLDDDVPTNDGIARAIRLTLPAGSAISAQSPSAVAAGNVEMSQRITDTIFLALADAGIEVPAQGQGTMNNVTLGAPGWTFYETLGGGQGASAKGPGPSAVHVGMSNTRNTPIESLERAYPLEVATYAVRRGSGGAGQHRGGDGVVRAYRALGPCTATVLAERRTRAPRGAAGGGDGGCGRTLLGERELPAKVRVPMVAGDVLRIETPGGGGWGAP